MASLEITLEKQKCIAELELLKEKVETQHRINVFFISLTEIIDIINKVFIVESKRRDL